MKNKKEFPEVIEIEITEFYNINDTKRIELSKTLKPFNSLAFQHGQIKSGVYHVETKQLFNNQYNTVEGFRIFEYSEKLSVPNARKMGSGYYISKGIEKIREAQKRVKECGYCGKHYVDSSKKWCSSCSGSEYLERNNYKLLQLQPLSKDNPIYDKEPPKYLINKIQIEQRKTASRKVMAEQKRDIEKAKKDVVNAKTVLLAKKWLIRNNVYTDNVIFYSHKDVFSFGWRGTLDKQYKSDLLDVISEFPYNYEIKEK